MKKTILMIGLGLMAAECSPRHDEWCYGHTLKHCEPAVYFATDSAKLDSQSMQKLTWVVDKMNRWPDRTALVSGNTDLVGNAEYNQALSLRRANAVKSYLVEQGIAADRIETQAYGKTNPLTEEAKDQNLNRRVDITFGHEDHKFFLHPDVLCDACSGL